MGSRSRQRRARSISHLGLFLATFALTVIGVAQEPTLSNQTPAIKVHVNQVLVPLTVADRKGHFVTELKASDFQVFEDGIKQDGVDFRSVKNGASEVFPAEASPLSRASGSLVLSQPNGEVRPRFTYLIVVDTLFSTFGDFTQVRSALKTLFERSRAPTRNTPWLPWGGLPWSSRISSKTRR